MANLHIVHVDLSATPRRVPPPLNTQPAKSILKKRPIAPPSSSPLPSVLPVPAAASPAAAVGAEGHAPQDTTDKASLVWDEVNLEETSRERGTRMKIEEVETPYAWPGDYSIDPSDSEHSDDDDDDHAADEDEGAEAGARDHDAPPGEGVELDALAARLTSVKRKQDAGVDLASHPEHIESQKEDFKRRRKLHYDEGKAWKQQRGGAPSSARK